MDLLSSVRKSGSRGGVNFSWDEVASSSHRENYLGHSLKAPVGRWQKGRDLNWYAKSEPTVAEDGSTETDQERMERERREEIKKVKEAEEDALARALGLPVAVRNTTGANAVEVGGSRQVGPVEEAVEPLKERKGGLELASERTGRSRRHDDSDRRERRRHRSRSRSRDRRHGQSTRDGEKRKNRSREREPRRDREDGRERRHRGARSRSPREERREYRRRSRSREAHRPRSRERRRSPDSRNR